MPEDQRPPRRRSSGGGGSRTIRPISLGGGDLSMSTGGLGGSSGPLGQAGAAQTARATGDNFPIEMALAETAGPWKKDRVILSLEAQSLLLDMRDSARGIIEFASQIYSNVVSQLKVAAGRILTLEPFGGYRIRWKQF